jgi:hypothetical protein
MMQEKKLKLLGLGMSNEMALLILPFGTGYLLDEEEKPDSKTIAAAIALQGVHAASNPFTEQIVYDN